MFNSILKPMIVSSFLVLSLTSFAATQNSNDSSTTTTKNSDSNMNQSVSAQSINGDNQKMVGKKISFNGKVDRVLGNGAYILKDMSAGDSRNDSIHKILLMMNSKTDSNKDNSNSKQRAGTMAVQLKEGDTVQLQGRVRLLTVSSEVDTFSPKTDTETMSDTVSSVPVIVAQPGNIKVQ